MPSPMRRSSLHGFASNNLEALKLAGFESPTPAAEGEAAPAKPVNSLAIATARSKRRVRRAVVDSSPSNRSSKSSSVNGNGNNARSNDRTSPSGSVPRAGSPSTSTRASSSSRRGLSSRVPGESSGRRFVDTERRQRFNMARLRQDISAAAARTTSQNVDSTTSPRNFKTTSPTRRQSAENGKLLFAAAAAAAATVAAATEGAPCAAEGLHGDAGTPTGLSSLTILNPPEHWKCIDPRGANFRLRPSPDALVGDGSGVDPGELLRVVARTPNWLKLDTSNMEGVRGSRWAPLRMYWGDNKQLFARSKKQNAPATAPRIDVVKVLLTMEEFNRIHFSNPKNSSKAFPQILGFHGGDSTMRTQSGHRMMEGMSLLTIGKWSLVRSRLAAVAAMLNARPDADEVVLEAKFRLPLGAAMNKSI